MDLNNLTEVVRFEITDDGFVFYDKDGNIPDPKDSYWEGRLNLWDYQGKSLDGLPNVANGGLDLQRYKGKSLKGLPSVVKGDLWLDNYKGNDCNNLPKEYNEIFIKGRQRIKADFDNWWKTEKLKRILLDY